MTTIEKDTYRVTLYDEDEANGVANILRTLLEQNFEAHPERVAIARRIRRPVAVFSTDTDSSATVIFGKRGAIVCNDVTNAPAVVVWATVDQVIDVSQLQMKAGGLIPVGFITNRGMSVVWDILRHRLIVKGLLTHTLTTLRLIALLSVAD